MDGAFDPQRSTYLCDVIDEEKKIWMVDLLETVDVVAVKVSTHPDSGETEAVEVRAGESKDFSENSLCWFMTHLKPGVEETVNCTEPLRAR